MKDIHDVIKHAKFGDDRLKGSGVVAGQISAFPIDFAGRPYNTLTLPCERVMNSKSCSSSVVLTATDKNTKIVTKVILPTITSPECQRDGGKYHFLMIFTVFYPSPLTLCS